MLDRDLSGDLAVELSILVETDYGYLLRQFLSFPSIAKPEGIIWAWVSDKQSRIPVKFTASAVADYNKSVSLLKFDRHSALSVSSI